MARQSIPSLLLKCLLALVVALIMTPEAVLADVVEPSGRITTGVVVREQAKTESAAIGLLRPNERLEFIGSVPQWNRVRLADGRIGYVSKSWTRVVAAAPATAEFTLHVVDVGTGLAVLIQGRDFALLYDGGSNDDLARGDQNRLLAYFRAAVPTMTQIDHLVVSHPHRDHVELLPDVVSRYEIKNVWDSGAVNDICGYRLFITAVLSKPTISYRSARNDAGTHPVEFDAKTCYGTAMPKEALQLVHGRRISHDKIALGQNAEMTFLHVDGTDYRGEYNRNSLVVRIDLGATRILLMGDAEAGGRSPLGFQPRANSVEGALLACCRDELRADILVVGHHGSKTSSRLTFLDAVGAKIFVVSAGPTKYATVVLPDEEVTSELTRRGTLFRTDRNDASCGSNPAKIGADADERPGGCDNIRIVIRPNNAIDANYWGQAD